MTALQLSRGSLGALAMALVAATFVLAFVDLLVLSEDVSSASYDLPDDVTSERVVSIRSVEANVGDVVRVNPALDVPAPLGLMDFYIVEGGEGTTFRADHVPLHVYARRLGLDPGFSARPVFVERPDPPVGSTQPGRLDLVWVVHFVPGTEIPTDPQARAYFDWWLQGAGLAETPMVSDANAVAFAKVAAWALYGLSAASVVALVAWAVAPRLAIPASESGGSVEASLGLAIAGERHLRALRNVLLGMAPALAFAAWASLFIFWNETAWLPGAGASWAKPLRLAVAVALLGGGAAWTVQTWRVQQALRRWRAWQKQSPFGP